MRHQDWETVVDRHIRAAGGDPRFVLKSMDGELEKIAGMWDGLARGAVGLGERFAGTRMIGGVARGIGDMGAGVLRRSGAAELAAGAETMATRGTRTFAPSFFGARGGSSLENASVAAARARKGRALVQEADAVATTPARRAAFAQGAGVAPGGKMPGLTPQRVAASRLPVYKGPGSAGAGWRAYSTRAPVNASPEVEGALHIPASGTSVQSAPATPITRRARAEASPETLAGPTEVKAPAPITNPAQTPTDIAGAPLWDQAVAKWKGFTPGQQMGAVAGAAAVPALGAGLMMGGGGQRGNTTIIQR